MAVYCLVADVQSILSTHGLTGMLDDDEDGTAESGLADDMIEMSAAIDIDFYILQRYKADDVSSANTYLKWCNALFAARRATMRRNHPVPAVLESDTEMLRSQLQLVASGVNHLPGQTESFDPTITVSNYTVERFRGGFPVRVQSAESIGPNPVGNRHTAYPIHNIDGTRRS